MSDHHEFSCGDDELAEKQALLEESRAWLFIGIRETFNYKNAASLQRLEVARAIHLVRFKDLVQSFLADSPSIKEAVDFISLRMIEEDQIRVQGINVVAGDGTCSPMTLPPYGIEEPNSEYLDDDLKDQIVASAGFIQGQYVEHDLLRLLHAAGIHT